MLANEFIGFDARQWIVDIAASDAGFATDAECGTWFSTPRHGFQSSIPPGVWLVGAQVAPGTYQANAQASCYWERRRAFTGTVSGDVIANDFVSSGGQVIVTIASSDAGFSGDEECGTWTRINTLIDGRAAPQSPAEIEHNWRLNRAGVQR